MKRVIAAILLAALTLGLCACADKATADPTGTTASTADGLDSAQSATQPTEEDIVWPEELYTVNNPMQYPLYTFDHEPTVDELRQTAVQAMHDMLSIEWCTPEFIAYQKTGPVSGKKFSHVPGVTFAGLPYTNGDSAIYSWFEYYDQETGMLYFDGSGSEFNDTLGNTCTGSIMWAWATVCDSIGGNFTNYQMTPKWGCYPVGDFIIPSGINSYLDYSTEQICEDNGREKILECYALCRAADGLSSSPENHGMMVIEDAYVVRNEDGSINAEESYLMIQDQRAGTGQLFYEQEVDGQIQYFSGRTAYKYTFERLYSEWYIPVTPAEFMEDRNDPYAEATVTVSDAKTEINSVEDLLVGTLKSNYPMCILKVNVTDEAGSTTMGARVMLDKTDVRSGLARDYNLSYLRSVWEENGIMETLESGKTYTVTLDVTVSTGEILTLGQVTVTA